MDQTDPAHPTPNPAGPATRVRAEFSCVSCGYSIRGRAIDELCPECGTPVLHSIGAASTKATAGSAVASLVLGIIAVMGCASYGVLSLVCGPLAIFFSIKANKALKAGTAGGSTKGMATAGLVLGIIGTALGLIGLAFIAIFFFGLLAGAGGAGGPGGSGGGTFP